MNERSLVNKVIALSFGQTQVVVSLGLMFRLSCLCFCSDSNPNLKCLCLLLLQYFLKFNDENFVLVESGIEIEFSSYGHDLKVLEVIHNL